MDPTSPTSASAPPLKTRNTNNTGIVITVVFTLFIPIFAFMLFFWPDYQQKQILRTGLPAQATVLDIRPTGNVYNSQPQVELTLHVQPPQGAAFDTHINMVINPVYIPQFQPQKQLRVHYDPKDHSRVAVDDEQKP